MMPVFQLETQDGRKFEVDAPDMESASKTLEQNADHPSLLSQAVKPITDIPSEYSSEVSDSVSRMGRGVEQLEKGDVVKGAANLGLGGLGYVSAPLNAPIHSIVGKPIENVTGSETAGNLADLVASILLPIPKGLPRFGTTAKVATAPARVMDVTLSEGQATRELSKIQREQAAARGTSGPLAQKAAQAFLDQQKAELTAARDKLSRSFDAYGAQIAEDPQEAAGLVQSGVQKTAASAKAAVDAKYREARSYPGEIHAGAFEGIGQKIKGDLSLRPEPVIIDSKLTPFAAQMIDDVDKRISNLKIENKADPFGQPSQENITGVNLQGVDQMRKRLSTMRKDAFASGNAADGRAAKAVLDAFDDRVSEAINSGLFKGDPRAIAAWNDARAAYADYRGTFTAGKNDPVGRVVEKIIGKGQNKAAIPNDVSDYMFGAAGVNPSSLNVGVVARIRKILGDQSPEWSAVKQSLFQKLTQPGTGQTEFGAGKVAQRLNRFLNSDGKEMANLIFSKPERDLVQKYADLMRQLEIPQAGANWSNTAAFAGAGFKPSMAARALEFVGSKVGMTVGAVVGAAGSHLVVPGLPFDVAGMGGAAASKVAGLSGQAMEARQIARQMPVISKAAQSFQTAATAAQASPVPRNIARLTLAAQNLATNLKGIGVNLSPDDILRAMQGPTPSNAGQGQPTQQQPPGIGQAKPNPGQ